MSKNKDIKKTNVARLLDRDKVDYGLVEYNVDESDLGAQHVAEQLGEDVKQVYRPAKSAPQSPFSRAS